MTSDSWHSDGRALLLGHHITFGAEHTHEVDARNARNEPVHKIVTTTRVRCSTCTTEWPSIGHVLTPCTGSPTTRATNERTPIR